MKNVIIFDVECTCWSLSENKPKSEREIIEIGAVRIDVENREIIDRFDQFIKPIRNPILSDFCKELTSIRQSDIDTAKDFSQVMNEFGYWMTLGGDVPEYIVSWGYFDKNQVRDESISKNYCGSAFHVISKQHMNLKEEFSRLYNCKRCGTMDALKRCDLEFEGTHHRGIDDAVNIAKIFFHIQDKIFPKNA